MFGECGLYRSVFDDNYHLLMETLHALGCVGLGVGWGKNKELLLIRLTSVYLEGQEVNLR